jgi:hypothetical protein
MAFRFNVCQPCCNECVSGVTQICVTVSSSCGPRLIGVLITATGPNGASLSGTTNSLGQVCLTAPRSGTYSVTAHGPCGDVTQSAVTVNCGGTTNLVFSLPGHLLTFNADSDCVSPITTGVNYWLEPLDSGPPSPPFPGLALPITYCLQPGNYTWHFLGQSCYENRDRAVTLGCTNQSITVSTLAKTYSWNGNVQGCGPAQGATVTVLGAGSATTDSAGNFTISGLKAQCSYTATVSKTRFVTANIPFSMACADRTAGVSLSLATGFTCWQCCTNPLTDPLVIIDSQGSHNVFFNGTQFQTGCIVKNGVSGYADQIVNSCNGSVGTVNIAYYYIITCGGTPPTWSVSRFIPVCAAGTPPYVAIRSHCSGILPVADVGTNFYMGETVTHASPFSSCSPLNLSFDFSFTFNDTANLIG